MLDKNLIKRQADQFNKEGYGYIHTEITPNRGAETFLAGDMVAILTGLSGEVGRISQVTKIPVPDVLGMVALAFDDKFRILMNSNEDIKKEVIPGEDWQEEWQKEERRKLDKEIMKMQKKVDMADIEIKNLNSTIAFYKKKIQDLETHHSKRMREAGKEIDRLEHRIEEIIKAHDKELLHGKEESNS